MGDSMEAQLAIGAYASSFYFGLGSLGYGLSEAEARDLDLHARYSDIKD